MSLKISGWRRIIKWSLITILSILFLGFFIRVVTWEHIYYTEKEGSERYVSDETASNDEPTELIEVEPTEKEVEEYVVGPERPRYLTIEKLGISNARILPVGINSKGELGTPSNIFDIGWYESSYAPGEGRTMLLDGHNGGPTRYGVFKDLPSLVSGDIIQVERGDGEIFRYQVLENNTVSLEESDVYMATAMRSPESGRESVTLISCTGEWSQSRQTYLSRQFVRAVLVK